MPFAPLAHPHPPLPRHLLAQRQAPAPRPPPARTTACGSSPAARSPASLRLSSTLLEQLAAAFATHNQALVPDDDLGRHLVRSIAFAADPATADIDAFLFSGPPRPPPPCAAPSPPGRRRCLLIQGSADGSYDLPRLAVEKVASINTAAAGGLRA